jgi:hypothetical protein
VKVPLVPDTVPPTKAGAQTLPLKQAVPTFAVILLPLFKEQLYVIIIIVI